jgi:hypothetical protein
MPHDDMTRPATDETKLADRASGRATYASGAGRAFAKRWMPAA